ncbi:MAG TPA: hypothetical protein VLD62_08825 [Acidimicrobiia bacterium]|nr:hypothetical protein [Acidimicrobiia bacterium]
MARPPSVGDYFSNWRRKDLRLDEKVSLTIRNNWKKLRTRSSCCGNHGEPGC